MISFLDRIWCAIEGLWCPSPLIQAVRVRKLLIPSHPHILCTELFGLCYCFSVRTKRNDRLACCSSFLLLAKVLAIFLQVELHEGMRINPQKTTKNKHPAQTTECESRNRCTKAWNPRGSYKWDAPSPLLKGSRLWTGCSSACSRRSTKERPACEDKTGCDHLTNVYIYIY